MNDPDANERAWIPPAADLTNGKDEMNLAEFPIASLRSKPDARDAIIHEGFVVDKEGVRHAQRWVVTGDSVAGLPTEFDERVYVALMALSARRGFVARRVPFSIYYIIKRLGLQDTKRSYEFVERSLDRLKGATIKTKGAFYDRERQELVHTAMAFNIVDKYWIRYRETDARIREEEGVPAFIVWGEDIWKSFRSGYIKNLDLTYFYSLGTPTARRLFRFLDKRLHHQDAYEIDIFELASRLGMVRYPYASRVRRKLEPAIAELTETGFLAEASFTEYKGYTRARFVRGSREPRKEKPAALPDPHDGSVEERLIGYGIAHGKARGLAQAHSDDYLRDKMDFLDWRLRTSQRGRPITDPAGWLIRAIKDDYQPPASFVPLREQRLREAEIEASWEQIDAEREAQRRRGADRHQAALERLREAHGTGEGERELWAKVRGDLQTRLMSTIFRVWIDPVELLSLREGITTLAVPNQVTREWIEGRFAELLTGAFAEHAGHAVQLAFEVVGGEQEVDPADEEGKRKH